MKIAEALINKSNLKEKISQIMSRINKNLLVQEGESPSEEPDKLIKIYVELQKELTDLSLLIGKANSENYLVSENEDYKKLKLQEALIKRDGYMKIAEGLRHIAAEGVPNIRYSQNEIKILPLISSKDIQKEADDYSKLARELDIEIQKTNWTLDI